MILNIFLGWSFIGWVIALVWSFTEVKPRESPSVPTELSDQRRGVWIVLAIAGAGALVLFVLGILILLSSTASAPYIYDLF
jgi:hypothetical protein